MNILCLIFLSALSASALRERAIPQRTSIGGSASVLKRQANNQGSSLLSSVNDMQYLTNITLNGQSFTVVIDTGSSDLWVAGSVPSAIDSGQTGVVGYAIGGVQGPVKFATLEFNGFSVNQQAYIEVTPDDTHLPGTGLIGLGPPSGSNISASSGYDPRFASALDQMFAADVTTPNILTILFGRDNDPLNLFSGAITVGEVVDNLSTSMNSQPQLDVTILSSDSGNQHFSILLDENGIIGPDGNPIPFTSNVSGAQNPNQATAVLDSGFTFPQVPKSVSDAIYSQIPGAEFTNISQAETAWIVPCTQEVNLTFLIGGVEYPISPLDTTFDPSIFGLGNITNSQGQECCLGTFQPTIVVNNELDMVLGMAFFRNVYALFNYGDFIDGSTTQRGAPFVQLLSTTDPAQAHADFVQLRLQGVDQGADQDVDQDGTQTLEGAIEASTPTSTPTSSDSRIFGMNPTIIFIIGWVTLGVAIIILVITIIIIVRHKRHQKTGSLGTYRPLNSGKMRKFDIRAYSPDEGQEVYDAESYEKVTKYRDIPA